MTEAMPAPRDDYKPFVPRIVQLKIARDFIGAASDPAEKSFKNYNVKLIQL